MSKTVGHLETTTQCVVNDSSMSTQAMLTWATLFLCIAIIICFGLWWDKR